MSDIRWISIVLFVPIMLLAYASAWTEHQCETARYQRTGHNPPESIPITQCVCADERAYQAKSPSYAAPQCNWPEVTSNQVLVIVGILTFIAIMWQANETRNSASAAQQSADVARDALRLTQGAVVEMEDTAWNPLPTRDNLPNATLTVFFRNFGNSVAVNVTYDMWLGIKGSRESTLFAESPPVTLAARQPAVYGFAPLHRIFESPEDLGRVARGQVPMRLWGTISYDDIFERRHTVTLQALWIPDTSSFRFEIYKREVKDKGQG